MSTTTDHRGNHIFHGDVSFGGNMYPPDGAVDDDHISSNVNKRISDAKLVHRYALNHGQADGSDVASETKLLHIARGDGELLGFEVRPTTAPTGGDKQYTVDIQKDADADGSWSSLLDAVITVDSSSVDDTLQAATLVADPSFEDGDALRIVITASGSTGSQGQGFVAAAIVKEQHA